VWWIPLRRRERERERGKERGRERERGRGREWIVGRGAAGRCCAPRSSRTAR
jgi:hypothetical protein